VGRERRKKKEGIKENRKKDNRNGTIKIREVSETGRVFKRKQKN
jgi:hypothetical protein